MAARDTCSRIAAASDVSLGPLPQVPLAAGEGDVALEAVDKGAHALRAVVAPQGPDPGPGHPAPGARLGTAGALRLRVLTRGRSPRGFPRLPAQSPKGDVRVYGVEGP